MTKLFYEPKNIYQREREPRALVCMRISCLTISMIILIAYTAFLLYASDGIITASVIIPKPYIPVPDLIITANFSFSMDCRFQYFDSKAISQTDEDLCLNYIVPTVCNEPDPNDLSKGRCIGKFQVPTELLDAPLTKRLNFSLPDKRYGIQFLINITDAAYNPKNDNGIVIKAYDQEFNPYRLPKAVNNLISKLDPHFIERLDGLNSHVMTYHQMSRIYIDRKTREFLIQSFWEVLGIPPFYFTQPYIDSRIESVRIPSITDQLVSSNYGILFIGTLNWIEIIKSDIRTYNKLDSIALLSSFYSLLAGVYICLFGGWSRIVPWGICQMTCCSRESKAKLRKKFKPKGVPLMPSTISDVRNLMEFLKPILLRSTNSNFSIGNSSRGIVDPVVVNPDENGPNRDSFCSMYNF